MKKTRCIFLLEGKKSHTEFALKAIDGFKAVVAFYNEFTSKDMKSTFDCNKSAVVRVPIKRNYDTEIVRIAVVKKVEKKKKEAADESRYWLVVSDNPKEIRENFEKIAEKCNIDIGDHKVNSTKEGPSQDPKDCTFCRYFAGAPDHYQPSMYESRYFTVIPNMGHFVWGSLLIVPKAHVMSFAELNAEEKKELLEVVEDCKIILTKMYRKPILFWENGSGNKGHGKDKSSIVHAHMHVTPFVFDVLKLSSDKGIPLTEINFSDLDKYAEESYLLVLDYDSKWYISYDKKKYIPRQYVRQLVAEVEGIKGDLWNWRKYPFWDMMYDTLEDFQKYLSSDVPKRIQQRTKHFDFHR